jgi:hypothetical protein
MNKLRRLASVLVLTLVLALSGFAGHVSACDLTDPGHMSTPCLPVPPPNQTAEPAAENNAVVANNDWVESGVTEVALNLLETLMLF